MSNVYRKDELREGDKAVQLTGHAAFQNVERIDGDKARLDIKSRIARQARHRAEESQQQAEKSLVDATRRAEEIVAKANGEAETILTKAREQEKRITDKAREAGKAQAVETARQEAFEKIQGALTVLDSAAEEVRKTKADFLRSSCNGVVEVIEAIAKRIFKTNVEYDRAFIQRTAMEALKKVSGADRLTLRVNPADLAPIEEIRDEIVNAVEGLADIEITEDSAITMGGLLIETDFGRIDARIETQLAELLREVRLTASGVAIPQDEVQTAEPTTIEEGEGPEGAEPSEQPAAESAIAPSESAPASDKEQK